MTGFAGGAGPISARQPEPGRRGRDTYASTMRISRRFLWATFAVIAVISLASTAILGRYVFTQGVERDARLAAQFIERSVVQWHALAYFADPSRKSEAGGLVERFMVGLTDMPDVVRVQVYSVGGVVLWSSNPRAQGHAFDLAGNDDLRRALSGELVAEAEFGVLLHARGGIFGPGPQPKPEHVYARPIEEKFTEYYIPVWDEGRSRVIGAVEIYKGPGALSNSILEGLFIAWICNFIAGNLMFLCLYLVIRRGRRVIAEQQQRLVRAEGDSAMGEVALSVAQNVRRPLGSIQAAAELIVLDSRDNKPVTDFRKYAEDILEDADRLRNWVSGLTHYAKSSSQHLASVDLAALVGKVVDANRDGIEAHGAGVAFEVPAGLRPLKADAFIVEQVLHSILAHVVRTAPEGDDILVTARNGAQAVEVAFDCRPSEVARMPAPRRTAGSGPADGSDFIVDIPMLTRIVDRMGGSIAIDEPADGGTRIKLSLPYAAESR